MFIEMKTTQLDVLTIGDKADKKQKKTEEGRTAVGGTKRATVVGIDITI